MRFDPKTEEELAAADLWPAGEYDFEVAEAEEQTSKSGNDMVKLTVHVFDAEGRRRTVFDYLVGTEKAQFKVRHFADAVGLIEQYNLGELLAEDIVGRTGRCKLNIKKDKSGQYPDQNAIADYLPPKKAAVRLGVKPAPTRPAPTAADLDDDIPF